MKSKENSPEKEKQAGQEKKTGWWNKLSDKIAGAFGKSPHEMRQKIDADIVRPIGEYFGQAAQQKRNFEERFEMLKQRLEKTATIFGDTTDHSRRIPEKEELEKMYEMTQRIRAEMDTLQGLIYKYDRASTFWKQKKTIYQAERRVRTDLAIAGIDKARGNLKAKLQGAQGKVTALENIFTSLVERVKREQEEAKTTLDNVKKDTKKDVFQDVMEEFDRREQKVHRATTELKKCENQLVKARQQIEEFAFLDDQLGINREHLQPSKNEQIEVPTSTPKVNKEKLTEIRNDILSVGDLDDIEEELIKHTEVSLTDDSGKVWQMSEIKKNIDESFQNRTTSSLSFNNSGADWLMPIINAALTEKIESVRRKEEKTSQVTKLRGWREKEATAAKEKELASQWADLQEVEALDLNVEAEAKAKATEKEKENIANMNEILDRLGDIDYPMITWYINWNDKMAENKFQSSLYLPMGQITRDAITQPMSLREFWEIYSGLGGDKDLRKKRAAFSSYLDYLNNIDGKIRYSDADYAKYGVDFGKAKL